MWFRNYQQKIKRLFLQGLNPKELAMSIALAFWIGIFPIYGTTTVILTFLALKLKLNLPIMIAVSYALTPIQFLLLIPFIRIGEFVLGFQPMALDLSTLKASFSSGLFETLSVFSGRLALAVGAWILVALPISVLLYIILFQIFRKVKRFKTENQLDSV
ncbi:hypothetical protein SAMN00777080_4044 [Aquiflexum balticum DSM 16537]|uniref:DUF2062 domain-containing protein n=1 Tax=Aquiflexum balticum DSM 16537 TaxID=758820 RepID=A0A1W2H9D9_9BACT|nr:DUF2062 domain-containing protein [Aquiflexum balticum]SMD45394.1 hypothetical protein SAMN00777080_4044 [Aquiflexum balticum DSM 16537]